MKNFIKKILNTLLICAFGYFYFYTYCAFAYDDFSYLKSVLLLLIKLAIPIFITIDMISETLTKLCKIMIIEIVILEIITGHFWLLFVTGIIFINKLYISSLFHLYSSTTKND